MSKLTSFKYNQIKLLRRLRASSDRDCGRLHLAQGTLFQSGPQYAA